MSVLPLPYEPTEPVSRLGLSRGCRQRISSRRYYDSQLNSCIDSVNWYGGFGGGTPTAQPSLSQEASLVDIRRLVGERVREERSHKFSVHEAVGALLKGKASLYDGVEPSVGDLAPFDLDALSLPDSVADCPF